MRSICAAALLMSLALVASCSYGAQSSRDLEVRSGCAVISAHRTMFGADVVMHVSATGCRDIASAGDDALERVVEAVWRSLRLPVDAMEIRLFPPAGTTIGPARAVIARDELEARFGSGPSGVAWPPRDDDAGDLLWLLLPVAFVIAGLGVVWLARRIVRAGVVVVFLRA